jgi:transposase
MNKRKLLLKKLEELKNSGKYEVFYQDEVHFKMTLSLTRAWFIKGTVPQIKSPSGREKMSVFGALGENGQFIFEQSAVFNTITFERFLQKLISTVDTKKDVFGNKKKILLVLDNARYHHAKALKPWLESVSDLLELCFLPPYSPDINIIERLWKKTRREVTHNRYFEKLDCIRYDLSMYWNNFTKPNQILTTIFTNI